MSRYPEDVAQFHAELCAVARWVVAEGFDAKELLDVIEKPWRWTTEAHAALSVEEATREMDL